MRQSDDSEQSNLRDAIQKCIIEIKDYIRAHGSDRNLSLTRTKLEEAFFWLDDRCYTTE